MILKTTYIKEIKIGSIRDKLKSYKWDFIPVEIILYSIFILIWVIQTWELMEKKMRCLFSLLITGNIIQSHHYLMYNWLKVVVTSITFIFAEPTLSQFSTLQSWDLCKETTTQDVESAFSFWKSAAWAWD